MVFMNYWYGQGQNYLAIRVSCQCLPSKYKSWPFSAFLKRLHLTKMTAIILSNLRSFAVSRPGRRLLRRVRSLRGGGSPLNQTQGIKCLFVAVLGTITKNEWFLFYIYTDCVWPTPFVLAKKSDIRREAHFIFFLQFFDLSIFPIL